MMTPEKVETGGLYGKIPDDDLLFYEKISSLLDSANKSNTNCTAKTATATRRGTNETIDNDLRKMDPDENYLTTACVLMTRISSPFLVRKLILQEYPFLLIYLTRVLESDLEASCSSHVFQGSHTSHTVCQDPHVGHDPEKGLSASTCQQSTVPLWRVAISLFMKLYPSIVLCDNTASENRKAEEKADSKTRSTNNSSSARLEFVRTDCSMEPLTFWQQGQILTKILVHRTLRGTEFEIVDVEIIRLLTAIISSQNEYILSHENECIRTYHDPRDIVTWPESILGRILKDDFAKKCQGLLHLDYMSHMMIFFETYIIYFAVMETVSSLRYSKDRTKQLQNRNGTMTTQSIATRQFFCDFLTFCIQSITPSLQEEGRGCKHQDYSVLISLNHDKDPMTIVKNHVDQRQFIVLASSFLQQGIYLGSITNEWLQNDHIMDSLKTTTTDTVRNYRFMKEDFNLYLAILSCDEELVDSISRLLLLGLVDKGIAMSTKFQEKSRTVQKHVTLFESQIEQKIRFRTLETLACLVETCGVRWMLHSIPKTTYGSSSESTLGVLSYLSIILRLTSGELRLSLENIADRNLNATIPLKTSVSLSELCINSVNCLRVGLIILHFMATLVDEFDKNSGGRENDLLRSILSHPESILHVQKSLDDMMSAIIMLLTDDSVFLLFDEKVIYRHDLSKCYFACCKYLGAYLSETDFPTIDVNPEMIKVDSFILALRNAASFLMKKDMDESNVLSDPDGRELSMIVVLPGLVSLVRSCSECIQRESTQVQLVRKSLMNEKFIIEVIVATIDYSYELKRERKWCMNESPINTVSWCMLTVQSWSLLETNFRCISHLKLETTNNAVALRIKKSMIPWLRDITESTQSTALMTLLDLMCETWMQLTETFSLNSSDSPEKLILLEGDMLVNACISRLVGRED